jgi:hypothetical protein
VFFSQRKLHDAVCFWFSITLAQQKYKASLVIPFKAELLLHSRTCKTDKRLTFRKTLAMSGFLPNTPQLRQQLILRALLWFSAYGLIVTLLANSALWILSAPLRSLIAAAADNSVSASTLSSIFTPIQLASWGLSAYLLLLLIGTFFGTRKQKWAYWVVGLLLLVAIAGIGIALFVLVSYSGILGQISASLTWGLSGLMAVIIGLFGWILFEFRRPLFH